MQTDRPTSVRQAIMACRKGGTVSIVGVYAGLVDKFPLGAAMNKALVLRMGQMHAQRYIPMLLDRLAAGEIDPGYLATHPISLEEGAHGLRAVREEAGRLSAQRAAPLTRWACRLAGPAERSARRGQAARRTLVRVRPRGGSAGIRCRSRARSWTGTS